eukprot:366371-Chlamydomonas_euryale.AAC.21
MRNKRAFPPGLFPRFLSPYAQQTSLSARFISSLSFPLCATNESFPQVYFLKGVFLPQSLPKPQSPPRFKSFNTHPHAQEATQKLTATRLLEGAASVGEAGAREAKALSEGLARGGAGSILPGAILTGQTASYNRMQDTAEEEAAAGGDAVAAGEARGAMQAQAQDGLLQQLYRNALARNSAVAAQAAAQQLERVAAEAERMSMEALRDAGFDDSFSSTGRSGGGDGLGMADAVDADEALAAAAAAAAAQQIFGSLEALDAMLLADGQGIRGGDAERTDLSTSAHTIG